LTIVRLIVTLTFDLLTSLCPKLHSDPQHVQFNSEYHHLTFYADKMAQHRLLVILGQKLVLS